MARENRGPTDVSCKRDMHFDLIYCLGVIKASSMTNLVE